LKVLRKQLYSRYKQINKLEDSTKFYCSLNSSAHNLTEWPPTKLFKLLPYTETHTVDRELEIKLIRLKLPQDLDLTQLSQEQFKSSFILVYFIHENQHFFPLKNEHFTGRENE
jgi:hypothetical protein